LKHSIQGWAQSEGSFFQSTKVLDRSVTITFNVKNRDLKMGGKVDASPLHKLRQQLIDVLKPNPGTGNQAHLFSYKEGSRELLINMRYEAGLDGSWDIRNKWISSMPVRFLVVDPIFVENNCHAQELYFKSELDIRNVAARVNGQWSNLSNGLDNMAYSAAKGRYGEVYYGGTFTKDYDLSISLDRITYWDGASWNNVSTGANGSIMAVAAAPNGDIYATGSFTTIGGVACTRIAKWNGTTWSALGTGLNNTGRAISIAPNGDVYVAGDFTTAGGNSADLVARYDGTWHGIGSGLGGLGARCQSVCHRS